MEPGHEDREYVHDLVPLPIRQYASMEPGHEDREYATSAPFRSCPNAASMEPGHEDREYMSFSIIVPSETPSPQWSPVMKTGNT